MSCLLSLALQWQYPYIITSLRLREKISSIESEAEHTERIMNQLDIKVKQIKDVISNVEKYQKTKNIVHKAKDMSGNQKEKYSGEFAIYEVAIHYLRDNGYSKAPNISVINSIFNECTQQRAELHIQYEATKILLRNYKNAQENLTAILTYKDPGLSQQKKKIEIADDR